MEHEPNYGLEILRISTMLRRCADNSMEIRQTQNLTGSNGWILDFLYEHEGENIYQTNFSMVISSSMGISAP